jgi:galactosylceramide sulfotransferase
MHTINLEVYVPKHLPETKEPPTVISGAKQPATGNYGAKQPGTGHFGAKQLVTRQYGDTISSSIRKRALGNATHNVAFLKVHKAGSTTAMNIFLRFAIDKELNIALPNRSKGYGFNYLGYGDTVRRKNLVPLPPGESYNILCNHVIYNRNAFRDIMPNDTVYVAILREPTNHFISASQYYGFYKTLEKLAGNGSYTPSKLIGAFLRSPKEYKKKLNSVYVHNRMLYDFGLSQSHWDSTVLVHNYIQQLGKDFKLVMLMEYFDESLVLMRRFLNWNMKDILYIPRNVLKTGEKISIDPEVIDLLKHWNTADYKLYKHFQQKFWTQVSQEGPEFFLEVQQFKLINKQTKDFCIDLKRTASHKVPTLRWTVRSSQWNEEFTITSHDCQIMLMDELPMLQWLITEAHQRSIGLQRHITA